MKGFRRWLLVCASLLTGVAMGGWNDHDSCQPEGECDEIRNGFVNVVEGDACRKLYVTGECNALCLRSLQAITSRSKWRKCAERCDWQHSFVQGAASWLELCKSRPAADVFQEPEFEVSNLDSTKEEEEPATDFVPTSVTGPNAIHSEVWFLSFFLVSWMLFILFYVLRHRSFPSFAQCMPHFRLWFRRQTFNLRRNWRRRRAKNKVLDPTPDPPRFGAMARGARKHLKSALGGTSHRE